MNANSPKFNPMDYCAWSILEVKVLTKRHAIVDEEKIILWMTSVRASLVISVSDFVNVLWFKEEVLVLVIKIKMKFF